MGPIVSWCLAWSVNNIRVRLMTFLLLVSHFHLSSGTPSSVFYAILVDELGEEVDPHAVHGVATSDGGYVAVGALLDSSGSQTRNGFIVKVDSTGSYVWHSIVGVSGLNDHLLNVQEDSNGAFFAGGALHGGSDAMDRVLIKYSSAGVKLWQATFSDPTSGTDGGIEYMQFTSGGDLVCSGFVNSPAGSEKGFRSGGQVDQGTAMAMKFTSAMLESSSAPSSPTWQQTYSVGISGVSIREAEDGSSLILLAPSAETWVNDIPVATLIKTDSAGNALWTKEYPNQGQGTDVAVSTTGAGYAITGLNMNGGGWDGSMTLASTDGAEIWHVHFGNPQGGDGVYSDLDSGDPSQIYDECFGIQGVVGGGFITCCGTGIEECTDSSSDPRCKWRALVVKFDSAGNKVWERTDSYYYTSTSSAYKGEVFSAAGELLVFGVVSATSLIIVSSASLTIVSSASLTIVSSASLTISSSSIIFPFATFLLIASTSLTISASKSLTIAFSISLTISSSSYRFPAFLLISSTSASVIYLPTPGSRG
ncbi:hypothetical protein CYMTET_16636 [Cymbomonas tetramitiformis]|uniref:Uncharacterized protein n=1 Tax=Cymbomonas tetramitiformis TaxID=36881 RepID=A0AAE0L840_9CHLO|nr:hypothetical protein CYMTET_16636 [Cymbomonas tetramitiformis]